MRLRDIQSCLRAGISARSVQVGPFLVLLTPDSDNPFRNYAVPVDGAAPTASDVEALISFFTSRDLLPRLEYVRPSPAVDDALTAGGFDVHGTLTLMALESFAPAALSPGYRVTFETDAEILRRAVAAQHSAYGEPGGPGPDGMLRLIAEGGKVAVAATDSGEVVGAGVYTAPKVGLVEIAGIGVVEAHRRHGLAGLLTSSLTEDALRLGHQPFLQVEKDEPERIYTKLGYRVIGDMADARRPAV